MVGDPRQLEPVVTLPWSGQKRLCRQFGVDPQWAPQSASVQSVADRASQTPNLLNVAVTRARRRLVVIGDYRNWSQRRNFQVLADSGIAAVDSTKWRLPNQ